MALVAYTRPVLLGSVLVLATLYGAGLLWRHVCLPKTLAMETPVLYTLHQAFIVWGILAVVFVFVGAQPERWLTCTVDVLGGLWTLYLMHRVRSADPGIIKPSLSPEARCQTVLELAEGNKLDQRNYCATCRTRKPLRSKHCRLCNVCVAKFDHHCPWTNNCVGAGNHRAFVVYLVVCFFAIALFLYETFCYLQLVHAAAAPSPLCVVGQAVCQAFAAAPFICVEFAFVSFCELFIYILFGMQLYFIAVAQTTNESSNADRLEYYYRDRTEAARAHPHKQRLFVNPFDRGLVRNMKDFFLGHRESEWFELEQVPRPSPIANARCKEDLPSRRASGRVSGKLFGPHMV